MSYPLKRLTPIHDPKSTQRIAHEIFIALECETLSFVWLLPLSCAILLNKAMSSQILSIQERLTLKCLHALIRKHKTNSFISTWINYIFFEIIEEEELIDDYS
jgi:hypothetical protein